MKKEYVCQFCGKTFISSYDTIKFCSKKCYGGYVANNYKNKIENFKYYCSGIVIFINKISDRKYILVSKHMKKDIALIFDMLYNKKYQNKEMQEDFNENGQKGFETIIPIWGNNIEEEKLRKYMKEYLNVMKNVYEL